MVKRFVREDRVDQVDATRPRSRADKAIDADALTSKKSRLSINNADGLSDSDSESSSDDDGCSSEDEQSRSMSKHGRWSELDEQRLLVYKKEDNAWDWIFPGRTPAAVRTRWNMDQPRGE